MQANQNLSTKPKICKQMILNSEFYFSDKATQKATVEEQLFIDLHKDGSIDLERFVDLVHNNPHYVYTAVGLSEYIPQIEKALSKKIEELAKDPIHEDGSIETAIPYFKKVALTTQFIYKKPIKYLFSVNNNKEYRILDIGTGPASFAIEIAKYLTRSKVVGYDISPSMLYLAKGHCLANRMPIDLILGKSSDKDGYLFLPFKDEEFDFVVSHGSMHHWGNIDEVKIMLQEINRILKPNGQAHIVDINPNAIGTIFLRKFKFLRFNGGIYQVEAFEHSAKHSLTKKTLLKTLNTLNCSKYYINPTKPLFPVGLVFHSLTFNKH